MAISMLKIRRPLGRLIFNMGIAIPGKTVFLIETAPGSLLGCPKRMAIIYIHLDYNVKSWYSLSCYILQILLLIFFIITIITYHLSLLMMIVGIYFYFSISLFHHNDYAFFLCESETKIGNWITCSANWFMAVIAKLIFFQCYRAVLCKG